MARQKALGTVTGVGVDQWRDLDCQCFEDCNATKKVAVRQSWDRQSCKEGQGASSLEDRGRLGVTARL